MVDTASKSNSKNRDSKSYKKDLTSKNSKENYKLIQKRKKQKNQAILNKVVAWQSFKFARPLACKQLQEDGITECGGKLVPQERGFRVVLKCPNCGAIQPYVPKQVIESNFDCPASLLRNQSKYHDFDQN